MKTKVTYHGNGKVKEIFHRDDDDERHGLGEAWYKNGTLRYRDNWEHGKLHGLCEGWHDNGTLVYRANYDHGERHGLCEWWYSDGKLEYRQNYDHGKLIPDKTTELQERLQRAEKEIAEVRAKLGAI